MNVGRTIAIAVSAWHVRHKTRFVALPCCKFERVTPGGLSVVERDDTHDLCLRDVFSRSASTTHREKSMSTTRLMRGGWTLDGMHLWQTPLERMLGVNHTRTLDPSHDHLTASPVATAFIVIPIRTDPFSPRTIPGASYGTLHPALPSRCPHEGP
ncbi:hypothetical protein OG21DRAFT_98789 [Imleria badia]|nr:hypothetical protein OG21DRAFT_98789 [Imleria badia]